MAIRTEPRQVRLNACNIFAPGLAQRLPGTLAATVETEGLSVLKYIQQIDIYESIFDNTISGAVTLLENVGLIELVPIVGVEYLWLSFEVDDSGVKRKFERMFRIIKAQDVSYPRHDHRLFTLQLSTHEFVASVASRISRPYDKWTCKDAVSDILQRDLGITSERILEIEETNGKVSITLPNYTPLQAINFFALLSQTKDTKESNFVFFETLDGFHFTSIAKLITDGLKGIADPSHRVYRVNPGALTGGGATEEVARNSIFRIYQDQTFDTLVDIAGGMLRSQMISFDFMARKLQYVEDSRYTDTFPKTTHLAPGPVYPLNYDQGVSKGVRTFTFPTNVWTANGAWMQGKDDAPEQKLYEAIVLHNRQMKEISHVQTLVELPGHPEIRAGYVMDIQYPSTRPMANPDVSPRMSTPEVETPLFSGPHLVTSVRHMFLPQGSGQFEYRMHLKVNKDSFRTNIGAFKSQE
jgi:hypothetical protein